MLVVLMLLINRTKIGLAIRAVAINPRASRLMGINSGFIVLFTFALAGFLAGVSGTLLGIKYSVYPALGSSMMVKGFIASVIGGLGSAVCDALSGRDRRGDPAWSDRNGFDLFPGFQRDPGHPVRHHAGIFVPASAGHFGQICPG